MVRSCRHNVVQIGPEYQLLLAAIALEGQRHRKEGDVLDLNAAAFGRGDEPIGAVLLTAQHGGKQLDEFYPADRRSSIEPRSITGDPHVEIAAIDRRPRARGGGMDRWAIAGAGILYQARTCSSV